MLDWLLDRGVNVNMTDHQRMHDGFNLYPGGRDDSLHHLNIIAADGDIDLFDHLVSRGADPLKSLALHSASENEDPEKSRAMVRHLLDKHKMDINSNNEDFRDFFHYASDTGSPLCNAVLHRNLGVVLELLERGARIMSLRANAVRFAVKEGGFFPALKPLLRAGANPTEALTSAVCHMNFQAAQLCLDFGADPAPALHRAIEDEGRRQERIANNAAWDEENGYTKCESQCRKDRLAEQNAKMMIEMLRSVRGCDTVNRTTGHLY